MEQITVNKPILKERGPLADPSPFIKVRNKGRLSLAGRILTIVFSLAMLLVFFFPLWNIYLAAPQYPEGLSLSIWVNRLDGNISTINDLNHYIGMKTIHQEMFSELTYMPYIIAGLVLTGIAAGGVNKQYMLYTLVGLIVVLGIIGFTDFYNWEYDYGHNLDPHAAIKVPGMSYQPPMLGSKQLLNFTATSLPGIGGIGVIIAGAGLLGTMVFEIFRKKA